MNIITGTNCILSGKGKTIFTIKNSDVNIIGYFSNNIIEVRELPNYSSSLINTVLQLKLNDCTSPEYLIIDIRQCSGWLECGYNIYLENKKEYDHKQKLNKIFFLSTIVATFIGVLLGSFLGTFLK
jgi:hypothetical protein